MATSTTPYADVTGAIDPADTAAKDERAVKASRRLHLIAAGLAAGSGLVHALAGEGHFSEWWGYGMFFLAVSISQFLGGAALLFWSDRRLYWTGIIGTSIVLVVWTLSRTVGVHIGPGDDAGPEKIGVLDSVSNTLELATLWYLAKLLRRPGPAPLEGALGEDD